ncbi:hypothetical protein FIBSPDRAFT_1040578 [Athelia psychrophila]|uniref:Solute carrier family 40 member n=1 Tax=Athelia psychrophila TaxID=1759441 RepID=A0A166Q779_9AGAM|nr:hypothetical protein FIBSPDRAFT_1040578 [Fibularhizoctonia sp. CBS 109695]
MTTSINVSSAQEAHGLAIESGQLIQLHSLQVEEPSNVEAVGQEATPLGVKSLFVLSTLRFSSAWGERSSTFAFYLFLVIIFPSSLLPASIYGFCVTGSGIISSGTIGSLIDKNNRLVIVRFATLGQKISSGVTYALFLSLFLTPLGHADTLRGRSLGIFIGIIVAGAILKVSTVCLTISIERDWASTIGRGSSQRLAGLNAWLRRVDLVCDLISPLFVSGLIAGASYPFAAAFLAGMTVVSLFVELILSGLAYRRFPELQSKPSRQLPPTQADNKTNMRRILALLDPQDMIQDFTEFRKLPVFYTTLSIASIYLTVLSFDGTMLTFLKSSRNYSDPFLAGQRAACTAAGLTGTVLFPIVSKKLGLVRTGSWSIWCEFICLLPVVVALYAGASNTNTVAEVPAWNAALLFGGMAFSRIGLWMFDLAQLQILQESLESHPRRNRLTSFQYTLQNVFDMAKYALTMGLARPSEFKWAGMISVVAVFVGGTLYTFGYARIVRGHLAPHWHWLIKFKLS